MDILYVSERYHPFVGGVETQMRIVAQELSQRHQIEVATLLPDHESYTDGAIPVHSLKFSRSDKFRLLALRLLPKPFRSVRSKIGRQIYRAIFLPKLRPLVRGKDIVHALKTDRLVHIAEEAAREAGVPFLITPYFHPSDNVRKTKKQRAEAEFSNSAVTIFALLETDREMLIRLGVAPERISLAGVFPLIPERTDGHQFRIRHGLEDKPIVLFLGRMVATKGVKTILDAAPLVWRDMPDVQFLFAGPDSGPAQTWFAHAQDPRIRYLGMVDEQEKGDALAACDVFCMPSTAEILPAVYLEAWSYGKPVIGGTAHGLQQLIEGNGAGQIVEQNPELLSVKLLELLRDETARQQIGERGRKLVAERFSKSALVATLEQSYKEASRRGTQDASATNVTEQTSLASA